MNTKRLYEAAIALKGHCAPVAHGGNLYACLAEFADACVEQLEHERRVDAYHDAPSHIDLTPTPPAPFEVVEVKS